MTSSLVSVAAFLVLLALLPVAIRWMRRHGAAGQSASGSAMNIVSAIAVGPHQKVVTVEVGPEGARMWLVLGLSAQSMTCLHSMPISSTNHPSIRPSVALSPVASVESESVSS
jgi:flagellar protein FliO/FliZ